MPLQTYAKLPNLANLGAENGGMRLLICDAGLDCTPKNGSLPRALYEATVETNKVASRKQRPRNLGRQRLRVTVHIPWLAA
jgi:hypothetical protein